MFRDLKTDMVMEYFSGIEPSKAEKKIEILRKIRILEMDEIAVEGFRCLEKVNNLCVNEYSFLGLRDMINSGRLVINFNLCVEYTILLSYFCRK